MNMSNPQAMLEPVKTYLLGLQDRICDAFAAVDGQPFREDTWTRDEGGGGRSRVLAGGAVFEQAGVNFSDVQGSQLPPAARSRPPNTPGVSSHQWAGAAGRA